MNILGIVTEYNPFHNGHLYHLNKSKELSHADATVCVMSGNFIQRGEPALFDKFARAKSAIKNGVDIVIELPVYYAVSTADKFASSAIQILDNVGITHLSFGSESGSIDELYKIASILANEPNEYKNSLKTELETGVSYPEARANALAGISNISPNIILTPNNILGIEYLKTIIKNSFSIAPIAIKRASCNYHEKDSKDNILSATGIREKLKSNIDISSFIPANSLLLSPTPVFLESFEKEILYSLRRLNKEQIKNIPDVTEGLENRIEDAILTSSSVNELIDRIKTKRYPLTRIKRIIISALLNLSKTKSEEFDNANGPQYIRILAFSDKGKELLPMITKKSSIPVVTSLNNFMKSAAPLALDMINADILSTNIYALANNNKNLINYDYLNRLV